MTNRRNRRLVAFCAALSVILIVIGLSAQSRNRVRSLEQGLKLIQSNVAEQPQRLDSVLAALKALGLSVKEEQVGGAKTNEQYHSFVSEKIDRAPPLGVGIIGVITLSRVEFHGMVYSTNGVAHTVQYKMLYSDAF